MLLRRFGPIFFLSAAALAIWCTVTHRWSFDAWRTPMQFYGDPLEVYARVQSAAEDLSQPLRGFSAQPRLAAPFGADWSRYPISDRVVFTFIGLLARTVGVFTAVNLAMAVVHLLDALAFYLCARFLRWRREWAMAVALLFSFASYNFRWSVTVSFSLTFVIPPLVLLCGWIARAAPAVRTRGWTWLAGALGAWLGGANPYLGFFSVQLIGGAILLQFARRREFARYRAGLVFLGVTGISFLLHNGAFFLANTGGATRLTLARNYAGSEIYALKLADLLIPPAEHPIAAIGEIGSAYRSESALRTEFFVNYLGIVGIVGLIGLVGAGLHALLRGRGGRIPDAFLGVVWTMVFSAVGGVNSLLAFAGLDIFRASNRNSIFILVWALLFFGGWCQRRWRPRQPLLRYALPWVIAGIGIADSLPAFNASRTLRDSAENIRAQRGLMVALEKRIGPHASVFQLPSVAFPEAGTIVKMPDYAHFSAYLLSDTLRFSYGALRGTAVSRCLRALGRLPASMLKEELEATGFSAIWIDRRGLPENGARQINNLETLGLEEFQQTEMPDIKIFLLHPSPKPRPLDLTDTRLYEPWDVITTLVKPEIIVFDGWYDLENDGDRSWRWARDSATAGIAMPADGAVELTFWAHSMDRGQLVLTCDGHEIFRQPISPRSRDQRTVQLQLGKGCHPLKWQYTGKLLHPPTADGRQLGFAVENLHLGLQKPDTK